MNGIPGDKFRHRIISTILISAVFCLILFAKVNYNEKYFFSVEPDNAPLSYWGDCRYLLVLPVFLLILLLPQICRFLCHLIKPMNTSVGRSVYVVIVFALFSSIAYCTTKPDIPYLLYFFAAGAIFGINEALWTIPFHPAYLDKDDLTIDQKADILKFDNDKMWKYFNIVWIIFIAITAGLISWQLSYLPPAPSNSTIAAVEQIPYRLWNRTMVITVFMIALISGASLIAYYFIRKTSYLHNRLEDLYSTKVEPIKKENIDNQQNI
ncbi:MAG: hypothetical protein PHO26_07025 [Dehalococcoidia bacterium]|nr:hypothetical protein [Dehalococcoidia bacterium]MDD5494911.1 hypothetical protein [Dehalococcoidia bacterium]